MKNKILKRIAKDYLKSKKLASKVSYELMEDIFVFIDDEYDLNGTRINSIKNKRLLTELGILDEDNLVTIKAHTPIIKCTLNCPAGGNPFITFDIDGNIFEGDFSLTVNKNEICDNDGNVLKVVYELYPEV